MGRTDDVLNIAGHRLSTGSIEAALAGHPDVAECAVIGVADDRRVRCPAGSSCSRAAWTPRRTVSASGPSTVQRVRDEVGAMASLRRGRHRRRPAQDPLGQILRKTMREMADGKVPTVPGTIEDASVYNALPSSRPGG